MCRPAAFAVIFGSALLMAGPVFAQATSSAPPPPTGGGTPVTGPPPGGGSFGGQALAHAQQVIANGRQQIQQDFAQAQLRLTTLSQSVLHTAPSFPAPSVP